MKSILLDSVDQYDSVYKLYKIWACDISSVEVHSTFSDYWNNRIDSPKMIYEDTSSAANTRLVHIPIQLIFNSEAEKTFWLLKNT
jgi:hypothetical protein